MTSVIGGWEIFTPLSLSVMPLGVLCAPFGKLRVQETVEQVLEPMQLCS